MDRNTFISSKRSTVKKKRISKRAIEEILNEFDFEKVHRVMQFLDWRWYPNNKVPSIASLKQTARLCLNGIVDEGAERHMTGGLVAYREQDGDEDGLALSFVIEEYTRWDGYEDE